MSKYPTCHAKICTYTYLKCEWQGGLTPGRWWTSTTAIANTNTNTNTVNTNPCHIWMCIAISDVWTEKYPYVYIWNANNKGGRVYHHAGDMNELRQIWMSHVTYEWVMSHMNESCHVAYEWVISHMNQPCSMWMSHVPYEWVTSHMNESCHTWLSHVAPYSVMYHSVCSVIHEPCHKHEWVMSRMTVTYVNGSRHVRRSRAMYEWIRSYIEIGHSTHQISHSTHQWVIGTSHVMHAGVVSCMNESCHTLK